MGEGHPCAVEEVEGYYQSMPWGIFPWCHGNDGDQRSKAIEAQPQQRKDATFGQWTTSLVPTGCWWLEDGWSPFVGPQVSWQMFQALISAPLLCSRRIAVLVLQGLTKHQIRSIPRRTRRTRAKRLRSPRRRRLPSIATMGAPTDPSLVPLETVKLLQIPAPQFLLQCFACNTAVVAGFHVGPNKITMRVIYERNVLGWWLYATFSSCRFQKKLMVVMFKTLFIIQWEHALPLSCRPIVHFARNMILFPVNIGKESHNGARLVVAPGWHHVWELQSHPDGSASCLGSTGCSILCIIWFVQNGS